MDGRRVMSHDWHRAGAVMTHHHPRNARNERMRLIALALLLAPVAAAAPKLPLPVATPAPKPSAGSAH